MIMLSSAGFNLLMTVYQVIFVCEGAAYPQYDFWYVQHKVYAMDLSLEGPSRKTDLAN